MAIADGMAGSPAVKVAIGAELIYQLCGANLSSPQSNELNAGARAPTLSKWVNLTNVEAAGWIVFLTMLDRSPWFAIGGGIALAGMAVKYRHAISSGLASSEPGTENYRG